MLALGSVTFYFNVMQNIFLHVLSNCADLTVPMNLIPQILTSTMFLGLLKAS